VRSQLRLGALTGVLALACGLSVANIYYAQPVLDELARTFHTSQGSVTFVVTLSQIGFVLGLVFVLPLGDLVQVRRLTPLMLLVAALALVVAGSAPSVVVFMVAYLVVGTFSTVAQVLVPFAAQLAPEASRGEIVGRVMGGLLLGILLARTVSSEVAAALGWRAIFYISGGLMLALALVLARYLPEREPDHHAGYGSLMRSVGHYAVTLGPLRRRAACQALMFLAFSAYWSTVAYVLIDQHHFSQAGIGLFALVGASGAAVAPVAGWLSDRGYGRWGSGLALATATVAMVIAGLGQSSVILLGLGGVLLDIGVQGHQIFAQGEIYSLVPEARARINTVYMGTVFTGGAVGSAVAGALHSSAGFRGVMLFAACACFASFLIWSVHTWQSVRRRVPVPA
jgi:predicted MFS family arabinose efflux permease